MLFIWFNSSNTEKGGLLPIKLVVKCYSIVQWKGQRRFTLCSVIVSLRRVGRRACREAGIQPANQTLKMAPSFHGYCFVNSFLVQCGCSGCQRTDAVQHGEWALLTPAQLALYAGLLSVIPVCLLVSELLWVQWWHGDLFCPNCYM